MSVVEQSSVDPPPLPGVTLRTARERAGLTLDAVSQRTMIPLSRLRALENDDYERVGVATFVVGYTRSYARFLGIDPAPLVQALEAALPDSEPAPVQPSPVALALQVQKRPRSYFWPIVVTATVVLVVVAVIGVNTASLVLPAPAPQASVNDAAEETRTLSLALELDDSAEAATPAELLPEETLGTAEAVPEEALTDSDFAASQTAPPAAQARDNLPAATPPNNPATSPDTLTLTFTGDCWIKVTDATGKALIARLATSRDNLQLFGRAPFEVVLGDAAAAKLALNGKTIDTAPQPGRKARRLTVAP